MNVRPRQIDVPHAASTLTPEQQLAAAVLWQAVQDVRYPGDAGERRRIGALGFFAGGESLRFWCAVAGLEPSIVQMKVRTLSPETRAGWRPHGRI